MQIWARHPILARMDYEVYSFVTLWWKNMGFDALISFSETTWAILALRRQTNSLVRSWLLSTRTYNKQLHNKENLAILVVVFLHGFSKKNSPFKQLKENTFSSYDMIIFFTYNIYNEINKKQWILNKKETHKNT